MTDMEENRKDESWEQKVHSLENEVDFFLTKLRMVDSIDLRACIFAYCFSDGGNFVAISHQTDLREALYQVACGDKYFEEVLRDVIHRVDNGHYRYSPSDFRLEEIED